MNMDINNTIMLFRKAWLRTIADYWAEGCSSTLSTFNCQAHMDTYTNGNNVIPWNVNVTVQKSPNANWNNYYSSFRSPFDAFLIRLPTRPAFDPSGQPLQAYQRVQAQALAAYYEMFPTILGDTTIGPPAGPLQYYNSTHTAVIGPSPTCKEPFPQGPAPDHCIYKPNCALPLLADGYLARTVSAINSDAGGGTERSLGIGSSEAFLKFGLLMLRIIARYWNDPSFALPLVPSNRFVGNNIILDDDHCGSPTNYAANEFLREEFLNTIPWNFKIYFAESPDFVWTPENLTLDPPNQQACKDHQLPINIKSGYWENVPPNQIVLNMPNCLNSTSNVIEPHALASYNDSGPAYPFSCT